MRRLALCCNVALVVATLCQPARAYVRDRLEQDSRPLQLRSPIFTVAVGGTLPNGLTSSDFLRIVRDAARQWSTVSCSGIRISVRHDATPNPLVGDDKTFRVMFRTDAWGRNGKTDASNLYDPKMLAVTSVFVKASRLGKTVTVVDADIEINAINYTWSASDMVAGDSQYATNLKATLMHEFGHVVGLDHPCAESTRNRLIDDRGVMAPLCAAPQSSALRQTLMYPNFRRGAPACLSPPKLSADEKRAVCTIYPRNSRTTLPNFGKHPNSFR